MKTFLSICCFLVAVAVIPSVTGEVDSCYKCISNKSWDDCKEKQEEKTCTCVGATCETCVKMYGKDSSGGEAFLKSCGVKDACDNVKAVCTVFKLDHCEVNCCDSDNCNAATGTTVSMGVVIMMGLTTLFNYWL